MHAKTLSLAVLMIGLATAAGSDKRAAQKSAQVGTGTATSGGATASGGTAAAAGTPITTLQQAHTLLAKANHDYAGHRAKAAAEITRAIHELKGAQTGQHATGQAATKTAQHAAGTGAKAATGTKAAPGAQAAGGTKAGIGAKTAGNQNREPQPQSDAQLQQALTLLTGVQGQLTGVAAGHVQTAIAELNEALKVK